VKAAWIAGLLATVVAVHASGQTSYRPLAGGRFESVLPQGNVPTATVPVDVAPFALRETPVTVAEFEAFVDAHPKWQPGRVPALFADVRYLSDWDRGSAKPHAPARSPVVNVSWHAARAYCESEGARLPTWLEWEYAAAADEARRDARADPAWRARILSWYERTTPDPLPDVGGVANAWGVRDLHGLVWEWVDDFNALFIAGDSRTQGDPDILKFCGAGAINIVDRDSYAVLMRIALLSSLGAADTTSNLGFRCAKSL
jgi:formylglycine-generating enzyme required for sulfatase activity